MLHDHLARPWDERGRRQEGEETCAKEAAGRSPPEAPHAGEEDWLAGGLSFLIARN